MERVFGVNALLHIRRHEPPRVIARQTIGHLCQIIGAKRHKRGILGDILGAQGGARRFDHHTQTISEISASFRLDGCGHGINAGLDQFHLAHGADQRNHHFWNDRITFSRRLDGGLKDGAGLHVVNLRHADTQTHTAHPQHRVIFFKRGHARHDIGQMQIQHLGQITHARLIRGQEFMQGRVKQPDTHRQALHDIEQFHEIAALHGQQTFQHFAAIIRIIGKDHLAHDAEAITVKEHMLCAAQPNPLGVKVARGLGICGGVRIGTDANITKFLGPA